MLPAERKASTVIAGISPDPVDKMMLIAGKVKAKTGGKFEITLLSDADHKVIDLYGLLNEAAAKSNRYLPHPTTYVIDRNGIVHWKFTEVNYKIRPSNATVLGELEKLPE